MEYSFAAPTAPSRRTKQYFEMYGHRGVYNLGWKAVTFHVKGTPFDADTWELYHVAEDWSEVHDVAGRYPAKLAELKTLWQSEARTFGVLPLDDRTFEMRDAPKVGASADRDTWTFYSSTIYINTNAAPNIRNRSHTITANVRRESSSQQGELIAHRDVNGGYTLYVRDNRLVYEYNRLGTMTKVESDVEVPIGESTLRFVFTKTGDLRGVAALYIGDRKVGETALTDTLPNVISYEGLSVGRDALSPVSPAYAGLGEFRFTGTLKRLVLHRQ